MLLSEIGYCQVHKGEPVRWKKRTGKLDESRSDETKPFVIRWANGDKVIYQVDDPVLAEIKYCPDMNPGQEFVISVYSKEKNVNMRLMMLSLHLAGLGKNESLREDFEKSAEYIRKHHDD